MDLDFLAQLPSTFAPPQTLALAEPAAGPDRIIGRQLALPAASREACALQALGELARASLALGPACLSITLWTWRLFPFKEDDASDDPHLFLSSSPAARPNPDVAGDIVAGLKYMRLRKSLLDGFDWDAFSRRHLPTLRDPILARSALLALWDAHDLRIQHLGERPSSRAAGDFVIGAQGPLFTPSQCPKGCALIERLELACATQNGASSSTAWL